MPVKIFFCYAHEDEALLNKLKAHLSPLLRQGHIDVWHDRDISAGTEWEREISTHLNTAQIILLLVSSDLMNSDYCYSIEMKRAIERHERGEALVIPIILRPVYWEGVLGTLQALPTAAKPVTSSYWRSLDEAFFSVVNDIRKVIEGLITKPGRTGTYRDIETLPPPTDPKTIQQREKIVIDVYTKLTQPDVTAIVLTGIGGVGKSILAALVRDYAENQRLAGSGFFAAKPLWLTIDPAVTFTDLAGTLIEAMGKSMPDFSLWTSQNQAVVLFNVLNTANRTRLVILDQFENLLDGLTGRALSDRPGVGEWLDAINSQKCTCRILLTSRLWPRGTHDYQPTHMQEHPLAGLETNEGVDLLRKQGVQATQATDAELRAAVERCDGHALSLGLLASILRRNRSLSLHSLFNNPTYAQLWTGDIARNLLDYIYERQLNDLQRKLLATFSVYREPVPLEAAQAVLDTDAMTTHTQAQDSLLDALNVLLAQHLLQESGNECYQLHVIVAHYAKDHFDVGNKDAHRQALRGAHAKAAQYYVQYAKTSCPLRKQRRNAGDVKLLIEAVWQLCQAKLWQEAYDLMIQEYLFTDLIRWGEVAVLLELCQLLLPSDEWHPENSQEALIYNHLGAVYGALEQVERGRSYCVKALDISRKIEYRKGEGMALDNLGTLYNVKGLMDLALDYHEQALAIREEIGDLDEIGLTLNNLGGDYNSLGSPYALAYYERALVIHREVGDRRGEGTTLNNLGRAYDELGRPEHALASYERALVIRREVGDRRGEGTTLNNIGQLYDKLGQKERALDYYEQALAIRREVGDRRGEGITLNNLGRACDELEWKERALTYYKQALAIRREVGDHKGEETTLHNIGTLYFNRRRYDVALACFQLSIFGGVQSPTRDRVKWLEDIQSKIGKKQYDKLFAKVRSQAPQIVEQALSTSLVSKPGFWRWIV